MTERKNLKRQMIDQLRAIHVAGLIEDGPAMRDRWAKRYIRALLPQAYWMSNAADFIRAMISHELNDARSLLKNKEGLDFAADYFTYSSMESADEPTRDRVAVRQLKLMLGNLDTFNDRVEKYNYSPAYQAMLDRELPEDTQRQRERLDIVVRNSR